ncbi:hypothetical protein N9430_00055 [Candidatus Pelagibacter sp.]|nr:hypothetical protein [Candidatus Pelagibacter sp.]
MFNINNIKIFNQPYRMFIIDDFINEKFFIKLREQVITRVVTCLEKKNEKLRHETVERYDASKKKGEIIVSGGGGQSDKYNSIENMYDLFNDDDHFKEFFSRLTNTSINKKFYRLLVPFSFQNFISFRPLKIHEEESNLSIWDFIIYRNCHVKYKLSIYKSNTGLHQHRDHNNKIISLLLYFGFTDFINRGGLGTQVYSIIKGNEEWNSTAPSSLDYYENKKLKRALDISPNPNRIFGFVKNNNSWHAVNPIDLPMNVGRICLQINLYKQQNYSDNLKNLIGIIKKCLKKAIKQ